MQQRLRRRFRAFFLGEVDAQYRSPLQTRRTIESYRICGIETQGSLENKRAPGRYPGARIAWNELAFSKTAYCETVCTTLLTGRVSATGILLPSLRTISSYSASVSSVCLAFICTTL